MLNIGDRLVSNICPQLLGVVVEVYADTSALVEVSHSYFKGPRHILIDTDYWSKLIEKGKGVC